MVLIFLEIHHDVPCGIHTVPPILQNFIRKCFQFTEISSKNLRDILPGVPSGVPLQFFSGLPSKVFLRFYQEFKEILLVVVVHPQKVISWSPLEAPSENHPGIPGVGTLQRKTLHKFFQEF